MTSVKRNKPFGKDFVQTKALRKYMDENGATTQDVADNVGRGVSASNVRSWLYKGRVPREVLKTLSIRCRKVKAKVSSRGEIYLAYVDADKEAAFKSFCAAMNLNIKTVL